MRARHGIWPVAVVAALVFTGCAGTYGGGRDEGPIAGYGDRSGGNGSYDDYDALAPYGTWVAVSYGWAWCPLDVPVGWRPYTVGRWLYSDAGWMWISDDPWGAVPYHYGRWAYDDFYGWVWIPGDVWAPAWVSWRYGDDWIGWAPLPPEVGWHVGIGIRYTASAIDRRLDPQNWCFVRSSAFLDDGIQGRLAPPGRNVTLIDVTKNVTRYEDDRSQPVERGLRSDWVSHATGRAVPRYRLIESPSNSFGVKPAVREGEVTVYRTRPSRDMAGRSGDDRVRAQPPVRERSRPRANLVERQQAERAQIEQRMKDERQELARIHEGERREPPRGISRDALRKRQEVEDRAQTAREARMRRAYDQRSQKFEESMRQRGRGRGQGERSL